MAAASNKKKRQVSEQQKAAMALGRNESRIIANYLNALAAHAPKRGRKRTPESIRKRLAAIEAQLATASPIIRVSLIQERMDLTEELRALEERFDLSALEEGFVASARAYSERKGITYAAWRELGVHPSVLKRAGIARGA